MKVQRFNEEEVRYLTEIIPGHTYLEIRSLYYSKFAKSLTDARLRYFITKYKVKNGLPPGCQKGHCSPNRKPLGSIHFKRGYIRVKIAEPDKWQYLHSYIWEKEYGPVPDGHVLIFADGNKQNVSIDNLILATKAEHAMLNRYKLLGTSLEATQAGLLVAKLILKIAKIRRNGSLSYNQRGV